MKYEQDMISEYRELFLYARDIILSMDEQIVQKKNKCQTSYNLHCRCIVTLKTTEYGIYLTVAQGALLEKRFPNKFKRLEGDGKIVRSLKYYSIDDIDVDEFKEILEEVIAINFEKGA
jgi:hypothetical protein